MTRKRAVSLNSGEAAGECWHDCFGCNLSHGPEGPGPARENAAGGFLGGAYSILCALGWVAAGWWVACAQRLSICEEAGLGGKALGCLASWWKNW